MRELGEMRGSTALRLAAFRDAPLECVPRGTRCGADLRIDWKRVDRELREIATQRAALDAEEARWLREPNGCESIRPARRFAAHDC
jgi:hypothetical protein